MLPPDGDGERSAVARLLGRDPAGSFRIVVRRLDRSPAVIENDPWLADGTPMPTRYWLVDPELRAMVSRLESAGGVRQAASVVPEAVLADAHARYAAERLQIVRCHGSGYGAGRPWPSGGVGGTRQGVKCLHAHLAWLLAGGDDPVGKWVAAELSLDWDAFVRSARPERHAL